MKNLAVLIFFVSASVYGAQLPPEVESVHVGDFSGGLDTNREKEKVEQNYATYLRNFFIDEKFGSLVQRNGYIVAGSTSVLQKVTGIFPFFRENGKVTYLVTDSSVVLETSSFQNPWTFVSSGSNTNVILRCIQIRNKMWCGNGVDAWFTWDGSVRTILDGSGTSPNVPKFTYPAYWQERVWGLNTAADGSQISFSDVITTDNVKIAPDDSRAWPGRNAFDVGQGDGQLGTGLWIEGGTLMAGKERSTYGILGTSPTGYFPKRYDPYVGPISQDSIVNFDNYTYFTGLDGIYKRGIFGYAQRISDNIDPDFRTFQVPSSKVLQNKWDTQSDFSKGSFIHGSTATADGFVTIPSTTRYINNSINDGVQIGLSSKTTSGTTYYGPGPIQFSVTIDTPFAGYVKSIDTYANRNTPVSSTCTARMSVSNTRTGGVDVSDLLLDFNGGGLGPVRFDFTTSNAVFNQTELSATPSTMSLKIEYLSGSADSFNILIPTTPNHTGIRLYPATTIQFTSEVSTLTSVTSWGTFDSINNTLGGTVNFFLRTSTSSVNIATQTWASITPGVKINAPTINNYVQWAATVSVVSTGNPTNIDNVTINHVEGAGSVDRAFAISWKNRYWLSISTELGGNFSLQYVKSKMTNKNPDAFMVMDDINVRSFAKDNSGTFYAGSASTGIVYRMDYGSNDAGKAITSVYQSPSLTMGDVLFQKNIQELQAKASADSRGILRLGTSLDGGAYSYQTMTLGTDNLNTYYFFNQIGMYGKTFNFEIRHNDYDTPFVFSDLAAYYQKTSIRGNQ